MIKCKYCGCDISDNRWKCNSCNSKTILIGKDGKEILAVISFDELNTTCDDDWMWKGTPDE